MQDTIDNIVSVGTGVVFGVGGTVKGLAILPSANESVNTFLMAAVGGAGGYLAKEGLRVFFRFLKKKIDAKKENK